MRYQVGGSLGGDDPNYVVRQADEQLYIGLKTGNFCYVLNSPQMGKSSLLQRTKHRLEKEGCACVYLDLARLGSESTTPVQWYKGIIASLFYEFNLGEQDNFKKWWEQQAELAYVQRLQQFVEQVLLKEVKSDRIFIFIDEIDSLLSLKFPINDFFVWIRDCYNHQTDNPDFNRLGFAVFGVVSPSDLINNQHQSPFNIGQAIELYGFQLHEATPLLKGLEQIISQPRAILQEIFHWTKGQPFLTQKLCQLVVRVALESSTKMITIPPGAEGFWIEQLVKSRIILHWESQDEPEHLCTIKNRLLFHEHRAGRLLGLYQQILQTQSNQTFGVPTDDSREQTELLLSGLVEKHNGYLKIKNPIYKSVFNAEWVIRQLDNLRPYSQTFNAWVESGYQDESCLLRGNALKETLNWAQDKSLSNLDYQFLAASQEYEQRAVQIALQAARAKEIETQLIQEKQTTKLQKTLLVVGGIGLLVLMALAVGTFIVYHQANKSESQAKTKVINILLLNEKLSSRSTSQFKFPAKSDRS